jgi:hypothetical protein
MPRTSDPYLCPLPDDQRRLRWLREDLTSCLVQIGCILRRTSGEFGTLPASQVTIAATGGGVAESHELSTIPADLLQEIPIHPPASITWTWADGTELTYDWQNHTCGTSPLDA